MSWFHGYLPTQTKSQIGDDARNDIRDRGAPRCCRDPRRGRSSPVKKSKSGLCHCPGGQYYGRTKSFTAYPTIKACLDSGGRHPKRGRGDCRKAAPAARPNKQTGGAADTCAMDGDTLVLNSVTVRLQGIDAPECGQSCRNAQDRPYPRGAVATAALRLMMAAGDIRGDFEPELGRYGRRIGYWYASDGTDINRWMVR